MNFETNQSKRSKYRFIARNKACSNTRFDVFFDHLVSNDQKEIKDFLVVRPKVSSKDKIVGVCILPVFNKKFCLMSGWRHQFDDNIIQAPTGFVECNEDPKETAIRELLEETSLICDSKNLVALGSYLPDAGLIEGRVSLHLALDCQRSSSSMEYEIGTGHVFQFTKAELTSLLCNEKNIGGSTLVTAFRAIAYIESKEAYRSYIL